MPRYCLIAIWLAVFVIFLEEGKTMAGHIQHISSSGVSTKAFGHTKEGEAVEQFTLTNEKGVTAKVITYGATLTELDVPDRSGKLSNVVLGFDSLSPYETKSPYFGATIGRCANRIAGARFTLQGKEYLLNANNDSNSLHGGKIGFDKRVWHASICSDSVDPAVEFALTSPDGDEGYPGTVQATVRYTLTKDNKIDLKYSATTDKPCPVNLTNHSYFNLAGAGTPSIIDQILRINADYYTPVDKELLPTGAIEEVNKTAMDFRRPKPIGLEIGRVDGGYDHNFVLRHPAEHSDQLLEAACLMDPHSGRVLTMYTTEPGVQFYSGNFLDGTIEGNGGVYPKRSALCLEAQHFPDAVHHQNFPSIILEPGVAYHQHTVYAFTVD